MQKIYMVEGEVAGLFIQDCDGSFNQFANWEYGSVVRINPALPAKLDLSIMRRVKPRTEGYLLCFYESNMPHVGVNGESICGCE